ncbi:CHY zinc finger protein [Pseudonocardia sp. HH130630-07]|uniref:CHY zinc finger protein n=1 Tax=Pseudonocardia sp. HH130630-07 TaxID=1690815 RepID=UPI000814B987|nr:CHY zinc finger protein [Pseudonocardia sp. HH130630-07]ANY10223.1 hypothetical protein AFB00_19995 [Pseudonocardia sp. HH130630-07]
MTAPRVFGDVVDGLTRCAHYYTPLDVIAIRFRCCDRYYPCFRCHAAHAGHPPTTWAAHARAERAVLCGVCRTELSIADYVDADSCPDCGAPFNPGCRLHHDLYFEPVAR